MADVTSTFGSLSSTESSNSPAGSTNISASLDDNLRLMQAHQAAWRDQTAWGTLVLTSIAGTNTITATLATAGSVTFGPTALANGMRFLLLPANTNTGATTLNITSPNGGSALGAKNVFCAGRACIGGELKQNQPVVVEYDGTQFNILGPVDINTFTEDTSPDLASDYVQTYDASASGFKKVLLGRISGGVLTATQASTTGTSIDFTGIPSWAKKITVMFNGVSLNASTLVMQLGDSGGVEATGYSGTHSDVSGSGQNLTSLSTYFLISNFQAAADVSSGAVTLTLMDSSTNTWACAGSVSHTGSSSRMETVAGIKATSAALDRVRLTSASGTANFDAGSISISYE